MRKMLRQLGLTVWLGSIADASPAVLDLSRSHTLDDLKKSGLVLQEIAGGAGQKDFAFQNQEVKILLPGDRSIHQFVELGIIDTEADLLTRLSMTGGVMPQEQAFQVSKNFLQSFNLPITNLKEWNEGNQGREFNGGGFGATSGWGYYPRISLAVDSSVNKLYPWIVRCEMEWGRKEQHDWNEERTWRELPSPAIATISLNPPSGQVYERRDAYKEALEEQARFEEELTAKNATTPSLSPISPPWPWTIGAILLLAVIGGAAFKFLRK